MAQGRKPLPSAVKKLRGNPGRRKLPTNEPKPADKIPVCPSHLSGEAMAEWNRIVPELRACGLLTIVDRAALAAYCQVWAHWVEAEVLLRESTPVIKTQNGSVMQNPYLGIANRSLGLMHKYLTEFGMTPSSRARVGSLMGDTDDLEKFNATDHRSTG